MSSPRVPLALACLAAAACSGEPDDGRRREPMATPLPSDGPIATARMVREPAPDAGERTDDAEPSPPLPERPPIDPEIERALDLIRSSGRRFFAQPEEADGAATEYTAEQFASMLGTKWDWIGYDIVTLDPWLDEIATRSFKTDLPYQVELEDGRRIELRGWLDRALARPEAG